MYGRSHENHRGDSETAGHTVIESVSSLRGNRMDFCSVIPMQHKSQSLSTYLRGFNGKLKLWCFLPAVQWRVDFFRTFCWDLQVSLKLGGNPAHFTFFNHLHWSLHFLIHLVWVSSAGDDGILKEFVSFSKIVLNVLTRLQRDWLDSLLHLTSDGHSPPLPSPRLRAAAFAYFLFFH